MNQSISKSSVSVGLGPSVIQTPIRGVGNENKMTAGSYDGFVYYHPDASTFEKLDKRRRQQNNADEEAI